MDSVPAVEYWQCAQISDPHVLAPGCALDARVDTGALFARALQAVATLPRRVDVVLITGDLVDTGSEQEYAHLAQLLDQFQATYATPVYVMAGNHDDRQALVDAFSQHAYPQHAYLQAAHQASAEGFLHYVVEDQAVRIVALDSTVPRRAGGRLCPQRLQWLEATLSAAPARPTLVALHHPPFKTGIGFMDAAGLADADAFEALIRRHPQVERVVSGHLHRTIMRRWGGTLACVAPSCAHQIALDIRSRGVPGYTLEPPGFLLHAWHPLHGLVTHQVPVGDFLGPYTF